VLEEIKLIEENDQALIIGEVGEAARLGAIEKAIVRFSRVRKSYCYGSLPLKLGVRLSTHPA